MRKVGTTLPLDASLLQANFLTFGSEVDLSVALAYLASSIAPTFQNGAQVYASRRGILAC